MKTISLTRIFDKKGYASMHMTRRPTVAATVCCKRCRTLNCSVDGSSTNKTNSNQKIGKLWKSFNNALPMQEAVQRRRCGKTGNPLRFEIQKILHPFGEANNRINSLIYKHLSVFLNFKCRK